MRPAYILTPVLACLLALALPGVFSARAANLQVSDQLDQEQVPDLINAPYYEHWQQPEARREHPEDTTAAGRLLIEARQLLAGGDTLGFERGYWTVVDIAAREDDFDALFRDATPLFTPREKNRWEKLETPRERKDYLYSFWKLRDIDPVTFHNERLVNHYLVLPEAMKMIYAGRGDEIDEVQIIRRIYDDPLPPVEMDFYGADFMGQPEGMEIELYHSVSVKESGLSRPPMAIAALLDMDWFEICRDSALAARSYGGQDLWVACHRLNAAPGKYYLAMHFDIPGKRAATRDVFTLEGYDPGRVQLSGIILGTPARPGPNAHSRNGYGIDPRPDLRFRQGEELMVYFEVYGLRADSLGERLFTEEIRVNLVRGRGKAGVSGFSGNFQQMQKWSKNQSTSLSLFFERTPERGRRTIPENFVMDTSQLVPGHYRLFLNVTDENSGMDQEVTWFFQLLADENGGSAASAATP